MRNESLEITWQICVLYIVLVREILAIKLRLLANYNENWIILCDNKYLLF